MGQQVSEKTLEDKFELLVARKLPGIIRNHNNNILEGQIVSVSHQARTATVLLVSNGERIENVKYPKGISDINPNDRCFLISPDGFIKGKYYIAAVY